MPPRPLVAAIATLALLVGCTALGDDDDGDETGSALAPEVPTVTVPPERQTPFCRAMIDLRDRLEGDPALASRPLIIETYTGIADQVPAEIADDFAAVLDDLRAGGPTTDETDTNDTGAPVTSGAPPSTAAFDVEEGRLPADDPALRLNAFVEFTCRDSVNNPGPPPTAPLSEIDTTDAGS